MLWLRSQFNRLYDLVLLAADAVKTAVARKRYPYSVPIHIVGILDYAAHYQWLTENVEDHERSIWTIMQKHIYSFNNGTFETHYIGEFRFKRKQDAVNYWLRFN